MKDLIPIEKYASNQSAYGSRFGVTSGVLFGGMMGIAALITGQSWGAALASAVFGGLLFGIAFPYFFMRRMRAATAQIFAGTGRFATSPPSDDYEYRLPSSYKRSVTMAVGGALYFAKERAAFVPHQMNLPRDREPFTFPLVGAELELVEQPTTRAQRALIANPPRVLRIRAASAAYDFLVPAPEEVLELLHNFIPRADAGSMEQPAE